MIMAPAKIRSLDDILETLVEKTDGEHITLVDALDAVGTRSFGPVVAIIALFATAPTGAVPGMPSLCGVLIILISSQMAFGRCHPWLPGPLRRLSITHEHLERAVEKCRPIATKIDNLFGRRMTVLASRAMEPFVAATCILLALTMPPLEMVPFGCAAPGLAITILGISITVRDGVMTLVGLVLCVVALGLVGWFLL